MAKKKNFSIKQLIFSILIVLSLGFIALLYLIHDAAPGNPTYPIDRLLENIQAKTKNSTKSIINFEIKLAYERLNEIRKYTDKHTEFMTKYEVIGNDIDRLPDTKEEIAEYITAEDNQARVQKYEQAIEDISKLFSIVDKLRKIESNLKILNKDYEQNLHNIYSTFESMDSSEFDDENISQLFYDVDEIHLESYMRTINVIKEKIKGDELLRILRGGFGTTNDMQVDLLEFGIKKQIDNKNVDFKTVADKYVIYLIRKHQEYINYMQEDVSLIKGQGATEEQVEQMSEWINEARDVHAEARDSVGMKPNKESLEKFEKLNEYYDKIGKMLSDISMGNAIPIKDEENIEY